MLSRRLLMGLALSACAAAQAIAQPGAVTVFAAASLEDAVAEAGRAFTGATGHPVVVAPAGSSILARQIEAGAPADVFISANADWMDVLEEAGADRAGHAASTCWATPSCWSRTAQAPPVDAGAGLDLAALLGDGRLAMALVDAVPAGIYGKAALESLGLWDGVRAARRAGRQRARRAGPGRDRRGALRHRLCHRRGGGAARHGRRPPSRRTATRRSSIPLPSRRGRQTSAARRRFLDFLRGAEAQAIFARAGLRGAVR